MSIPKGKSIIDSRGLYKIKHVENGSIEKYRAKFVAHGFSQRKGIDHDKTFAPITRYTSIRVIMSLTSPSGWPFYQMDIKIMFLNALIDEEVYISHPRGFEVHGQQTRVCQLTKDLYG